MIDPDTRIGIGSPESMAAGLRTSSGDLYRNMPQFTPPSDPRVALEQQRQDALNRIAGMGREIAPLLQPPPSQARRRSSGIYYNPALDRYSIGGVEFGSREYDVALNAGEYLQRGDVPPQGVGWQAIAPGEFEAYLNDITSPRSILGSLGMGARSVGEGIIGGIGRGLQMADAPGGDVLAGLGEAIGPGDAELARSAAIRQRQGFAGQVGTAITESAPSLAASIAAAAGGARIGASFGGFLGPKGAAIGAGIGGLVGAAASIFPMELQSSWEAAEQRAAEGGPSVDDAGVQTEILLSALTKTSLQSVVPTVIGRGLSGALREAASEAVQRTMGSRISRGIGYGAMEGAAEASAVLVDRVVFDPELRAVLNEADIAALTPLVFDKYGEEIAVAFAAGAALGGPLGALSPTVVRPRRDVDSGEATDMLGGASVEPIVEPSVEPGESSEIIIEPILPLDGPTAVPQLEAATFRPPTPNAPQGELLLRGGQGVSPVISMPGEVGPPPAPSPPDPRQGTLFPEPGDATFRPPEPNAPQGELLLRGGRGVAPVISLPGEVGPPPAPSFPDPRQGTLLREDELDRMQAAAGAAPAGPAMPQTQMAGGLAGLRQQMEREAQFAQAQNQRAMQEQVLREAQARQAEQQRVEQGVPELQAEPAGTLARRNQLLEQRRARMEQVSEVTPETLAAENPELAAQLRAQGVLEPAIPEGHFGTAKGEPFKSELAARGQRNRVAQANNLDRENLTAVQVPGGWALRDDTPPAAAPEPAAAPAAEAPAEVATVPEGHFGSTKGGPFKSELAARGQRNRVASANNINRENLTAVEVPGGWALRDDTPSAPTPTPTRRPRGRQGLRTRREPEAAPETETQAEPEAAAQAAPEAREEPARAVQEPSAETRPVRQRPRARAGVRAEDAQRQEAAQAREAEEEAVAQARRAEIEAEPLTDTEVFNDHVLQVETATSDDAFVENLAQVMWWAKNGGKTIKARAKDFIARIEQDSETKDLVDLARRLEEAQRDELGTSAKDLLGADLDYQIIAQTIQDLNSGKLEYLTSSMRGKVAAAWRKIKASNPQYGGEPLANFLKPNSLEFFNFGPRDPQTDIRPVVSAETGRTKLSSFDTILNPLPKGRVEMLARTFVRGLAIKPKLSIVRNVEELQRRSPALFAEADASRPQGDFADLAQRAAGYSFGDGKVLVFSDNIESAEQLRAVLAHETLGHFGMRGVVGDVPFNKLMASLYDASDYIRFHADAAMDSRKMSKAEAVEEYLADYAARLETSLISRVWNMLKNGLNKLGLKFGDDAARYLVSQARRYVRTGRSGDFFVNSDIAQRIYNMESGLDVEGSGRFAMADPRPLSALGLLAGALNGDAPRLSREGLVSRFDNVKELYDRAKKDFFSLTNYRSLKNPGARKFYETIVKAGRTAMRIKNDANALMDNYLNPQLELGVVRFGDGTTKSQKETTDRMLYAALGYGATNWKMRPDAKRKPLVFVEDGVVKRNEERIAELRKQGRRTLEEFRDGFSYTVYVDTVMDDAQRAKLRAERDAALEGVTDQAERDQITKDYKARIEADSYMRPDEDGGTFAGIPGLTKDSMEWRNYLAAREALEEVEIQLVEAHYKAHLKLIDSQLEDINDAMGQRMTNADRDFLLRMNDKYIEMYTADMIVDEDGSTSINPDSMERADQFLQDLNRALIAKEAAAADAEAARRNEAVLDAFDASQHDDITASIEDFKTRFPERESSFVIQNKLKELVLSEISRNDGAYGAERSIGTGYLPLVREGRFEARVQAVDVKTGKPIALKESFQRQLSYHQVEGVGEAKLLAQRLNDLFGDTTHEVIGADGNTYTVTLRAQASSALEGIAAPPQLNLNEFIIGLRRFAINLEPEKMKRVVQELTEQNSRARNRLQRQFVSGAETDGAKATAQHIESRASTIAKTLMRPELDQLMNLSNPKSRKLWYGDEERLAKLKRDYDGVMADPASNDAARKEARRAYETYRYQMRETVQDGVNMGNKFHTEAARTLSFLESQRNLDETDLASGDLASKLRAATSMAQLGASPATAALNIVALATNTAHYLASYNKRNGFGGGFGYGPSTLALTKAMSQVGAPGVLNGDLETADYYSRLATDEAAAKKAGLTTDEAKFLADQIRDGVAVPALSNSLIASARGRLTTASYQKLLDGWMGMFNRTESASRRTALLAAYRLQYDRSIQSGKPPEQAVRDATDFAVRAGEETLGEYSVMNRPAMWRGGIQQFAFMYQVFPTMSVQLLQNLDRKGQLVMMAGLLALSGVAGLPFAEDIEDIVDTISSMLGLRTPSIRLEMAKALDEMLPGISPVVLTGLANSFFPGDLGARTSLGNLLPATGIFLPGADVGRELLDIVGPIGGFAQASLATTGAAAGWAAYAAGVSPRPASLEAIVRNMPVTMFRAWGDAYAYTQSGAVIDRRGYVITEDMNAMTVMARALGFFPGAASDEYGTIRVAQRIGNMQRDVAATFYNAYVQARLRGDMAQANQVLREVRQWNQQSRGSGMEIRNFQANAVRRFREAQRPASERTIRSAPRNLQETYETAAELLGY